ncbi:MAG TPA: GGDEF domain-containing protein [Spirochaetota bacterium]|nr:GGDEF domain-containing protein [Spirochaetota bacterium]HOL57428.1 GGDEF domain-containing protein [Spirochaetota bacterium]HPP04998.1 GGDEF domain-containing protein [Spirochaetota bacterium]
MRKEKIKNMVITIFTITFMLIIFSILYSVLLVLSDSENKIFLKEFYLENKIDKLDYRLFNDIQKKTFIFKTTIPELDFLKIKGDSYKIILYRVTGAWYKVYFNNILIGSVGNLKNDRSIIWNTINSFDIDKNLLKNENEVVIEIYATYEVGKLGFPPLITNISNANKILNWFRLILLNIYVIAIGILWFAFIILLILSYLLNKAKKEFFYYALAALFFSFYIFDNVLIYDLSIPLIIFKKFIFLCVYTATALVSYGIYIQFNKKINLFLSVYALVSLIIIIIISSNMVILKKVGNIFNIVIFFNIFGWIFTTFKERKKNIDATVILTASIFLLISFCYDMFFSTFEKTTLINIISINIYSAIIFAISLIILVIFNYIDLEKNIIIEKEKKDFFYRKSIIDQMTELFNHQFIVNKIEELKVPYSIVMIDTDNFKPINDTYGHQTGDMVIKHIANEIKNNIREIDFAGRYGGDEFVAILVDCNEDEAFKIAERIYNGIKKPFYTLSNEIINISVSIGIYASKDKESAANVFHKADMALYKSKKDGKGKITIYNNSLI